MSTQTNWKTHWKKQVSMIEKLLEQNTMSDGRLGWVEAGEFQ